MSRRRWVYINGEAVEVGENYTPEPRTVQDSILWNDRQYQDLGDSRFSSRLQYQEYCRRTGLTNVSDFKNQWYQDEKRRHEAATGADRTRRADVAEAIHKLRG